MKRVAVTKSHFKMKLPLTLLTLLIALLLAPLAVLRAADTHSLEPPQNLAATQTRDGRIQLAGRVVDRAAFIST